MNEQEIKEAAYELWEKAGKPDGHDLEHWFAASENTTGEESTASVAGSGSANTDTVTQAHQPLASRRSQNVRKK